MGCLQEHPPERTSRWSGVSGPDALRGGRACRDPRPETRTRVPNPSSLCQREAHLTAAPFGPAAQPPPMFDPGHNSRSQLHQAEHNQQFGVARRQRKRRTSGAKMLKFNDFSPRIRHCGVTSIYSRPDRWTSGAGRAVDVGLHASEFLPRSISLITASGTAVESHPFE